MGIQIEETTTLVCECDRCDNVTRFKARTENLARSKANRDGWRLYAIVWLGADPGQENIGDEGEIEDQYTVCPRCNKEVGLDESPGPVVEQESDFDPELGDTP